MATQEARGTPPVAPDAAPVPQVRRRWVVLAISIGSLMGALDASIVNIALPYIRANLGATVSEVAWAATGYIIATVIVMPLTAWLGFTVGRKRAYMFSLGLFTISSFFCGNAHTLSALVFFRVLQGLGAGVLMPVQQAILRESFRQEEQGFAMGLFGLAVMLGPAIGPTLGGWITDNYNWPWIFYINVPIGFVALWMVQQFVHDPPHITEQRGKAGVDGIGIALLAVGLGALQTVLGEGQRNEWFESDIIMALTVVAAVALCVFVWWEVRAKRPAVDLTVLKDASFASGTFIGGILGLSLFASLFLLPLFMQELLRYPALKSGLVLMPRSVVMMALMPVAGLLYNRLGPRMMVGGGLAVAGAGALMMSRFSLDTGTMELFWPQVIQGLGFVFVFVALSTAALSSIPRAKLTGAAGLYNLVRQLGASFGTAIFATLVERQQQANHALLAQHINPYSPAFTIRLQMVQQGLVGEGVDPWTARMKALAILDGMVSGQAAVLAFANAFFIIGALFFVCVPLVFLLKTARPTPGGGGPPVE